MPMIASVATQKQRAAEMQDAGALDPMLHPKDVPWGDTFAATVGQTVDEELTISRYLNRELEVERQSVVNKMADEGFDLTPYTREDDSIDYDRLKRDTDYPGLKDNATIVRQRQEMLDRRHTYAQGVMQGNVSAQFAGGFVGAALDPVNVLSMGLAAPAAALRGAATAGQAALRLAGAEGAINLLAEIPIQAAVYDYKKELGRDYGTREVVTALAGAAAFGGVVGGIAGYLGKLARGTDPSGRPVQTPEDRAALEVQERILREAPHRQELETGGVGKIRETVVELARLSTDDLRAMTTGTFVDPDIDSITRRIVAERLIRGRERVKRRAAKGFEPGETPTIYREVGDVTEEVGPGRVSGAVRASDARYGARLRGELKSLREALTGSQARLADAQERLAKAKTKRTPARKLKPLTREIAEEEKRIADIEAKVAGVKERLDNRPVDVEETAKFQQLEQERVDRLNAADEAFIDRVYNDALVEADIATMRKLQEEYADFGRATEFPDDPPPTRAMAEDDMVKAARAEPDAEMRAAMERVDKLEAARVCYVS